MGATVPTSATLAEDPTPARARPRRRLPKWIAGITAALAAVCTFRAATTSAPQIDPGPRPATPEVIDERAAADLAAMVAIPTVSIPSGGEPAAFVKLDGELRTRFAGAFAALEVEHIHEHSLVMRWPGRDPSTKPIILTAHLDVVPVEPGTEAEWTQPPFSGAIEDGFVWGRGTLDDKLGVVGILSAVQSLVADGFVPSRDVWIAFGHDEEVGGSEGAVAIAAWLQQRGVHAELLLDEGGAVVTGAVPGITAPIAFVGIAEKGYATFELTTRGEGGHSSMPQREGAVVRLSQAIARLDENPMPAAIRGATSQLFDRLTPEQTFVARLVLANRWMFDPLLKRVLAGHPATNATIRTTYAPTVLEAGSADNVIAANARALINFRILPGDTTATVEAHINDVLDGLEVGVRCTDKCWDPSPISRTEGAGWDLVSRAIAWTWPEAVIAPSLVVGATDARHYAAVADDVYRFSPLLMADADRKRLHGADERIAVDNVGDAVRFFQVLLVAAAG